LVERAKTIEITANFPCPLFAKRGASDFAKAFDIP
jgi:hypothetical protein